jgi:hypothetical protein
MAQDARSVFILKVSLQCLLLALNELILGHNLEELQLHRMNFHTQLGVGVVLPRHKVFLV